MKKVSKEDIQNREIELPESCGCVSFWSKGSMLYCRMTSNIKKYLNRMFEEDIEERTLGDLIEESEETGYEETGNIFSALLLEKSWRRVEMPEYNRRYRDYDAYIYLGLNFQSFPYIRLENETVKDSFYLGPFRDIYLVRDAIDILSRVFGTPICAEPGYPCELLERKQCKGYCVQDQERLVTDLVRYYLLPEQQDLEVLEDLKQRLLSDLRFEEAEEIGDYQRILQRFYGQVTFLTVTKSLQVEFEYAGKKIVIEKGLLKQAGERHFMIEALEYRANELYAVDKSEIDERWVIFNQVKQKIPEQLKAGYEQTRQALGKYLLQKEGKNE